MAFRPKNRSGSKKKSDISVNIIKGKPSLQVNWGGRVYGAPLSLLGSGNIKDSLEVSDIRATGNITFSRNSAVYNNSNKILMVGGLVKSGDKNMSVGDATNVSSMIGHDDNAGNLAIGTDVMEKMLYGKENVAMGTESMRYIGRVGTTAASNAFNVAIGYHAMKGLEAPGGSDNGTGSKWSIAIGWEAMA